MELILHQLITGTAKEEEVVEEEMDDEVSFVYYGDFCTCSKASKCKSSKCLCYLRGNKCSPKCHDSSASKCTNK